MKRLSVDIPKKVYEDFIDIIPWGYKCQLIRALINLCMQSVVAHGVGMISSIIAGKCEIKIKEDK